MFTLHTHYDTATLAAMAKALRKTLRRKKNRRTRTLGMIVALLGAALMIGDLLTGDFGLHSIITLIACAAMVLVLIFEDSINAYFAQKKLLHTNAVGDTTFKEDCYTAVTQAGTTDWKYENILLIAQNERYLIFILGPNHGQAYDKTTLQGGSWEEFAAFISQKCSRDIEQI